MQAVVQKWGNSLGFRIPSLWAKDNNVKNGSNRRKRKNSNSSSEKNT